MPTRIHANIGPFYCKGGSFVPDKGTIMFEGNPPPREHLSYGKGAYSGLIIVGLNRRDGDKNNIEDIIATVRDTRIAQVDDPGSSFISQKGLYKHKVTGETVSEESVRVIIMLLTDETPEEFRENVLVLAEDLADKFDQEEVIVEFQDRGVTDFVIGVK